jgi:hypothetical protein
MQLTGGQVKFDFMANQETTLKNATTEKKLLSKNFDLKKITASNNDLAEHDARLEDIKNRHSVEPLWNKLH